jgi:outer membrane protein assembly factor BamB
MEDQGDSWAAGIDAATGETRWTIDREREATWTSPTVLRGATSGRGFVGATSGGGFVGATPAGARRASPDPADLVLLQSKSRLSAHDPRTGREVFTHNVGCSTISSNAVVGDCIYLPSGGLTALRYRQVNQEPAPERRDQKAATGGRASLEQLWQEPRLQPESASPVVHDGRVYVIKSAGVLVCGDASSGKVLWQLRLRGPIWATPVLAGGHLYVVNHDGLVQVVRLGSQGTLVGTGQIDKGILASPAVADGAIYFRSNQHLWKVAATGAP